jgi:2-methylcitrate dehydratase PrpD
MLTALHSANAIHAADVRRIEITTFGRGLTLTNKARPDTLEDAHYSYPFCAALAVLRGPRAFLPITEDVLRDRDVLWLAEAVTVTADPALDRAFPRRTPAVVRVHTVDGVREMTVDTAQGDPTLPFAPGVLQAKHRHLLRQAPTGLAVEEALADNPVDAHRLLAALAGPAAATAARRLRAPRATPVRGRTR